MFAKTYGAMTFEIDGRIIGVEVDVSPGLPRGELVGLSDTVGEGVEGAGDSPSRLTILLG